MLGELQGAQSEVSTFIEESASNEYVEEQLAVDPEDANETQVRTAITAADDAAELALKNDGGLGQGDSLNVLKAKVLDAEEALTEAESAVAEEDGLTSAKASLASAEAGYEGAIKASDAADTALNAEIAKVEELNGGTGSLDLVVNPAFDGDADKTLVEDASSNPIIVLGDGNQLVTQDGVNTEANPIEGFDALLAAAQEAYDKSLAEESAKDTFEAELEDVLDIESPEWKESDISVNVVADANKVEAVQADTVLFDEVSGNYIATADGTNYYDATSNGDGTFSIDSSATTTATVANCRVPCD
ncbi:hypothetical protein ACRHM7_13010 [Chromohalobacter israelensis]|uniref:hypothetical protein n=1 Tax=Chromohalobacter israelensis TaxID=141390 RepID=UPI003D79D099